MLANRRMLLTAAACLAVAGPAAAESAQPSARVPNANAASARVASARVAFPADAGPLTAATLSVTLVPRLADPAGAEALLAQVSTRGDSLFRKFLTPSAFASRFGPSAADIAAIQATLSGFGLEVVRASTSTLRVTGTPAALDRAFQVELHGFTVAAQAGAPGYSFHAPLQRPTMPAAIAPLMLAVFGLDSRPALHPHLRRLPQGLRPTAVQLRSVPAIKPPDMPGLWTVTDFADYYNATPLYKAGIDGAGHTIGIATLASFTPSDAYTYWRALGLTVSPTRITEIEVDGGAGAPSDDAGSDETTLDVEQSGGIAPGAKVLVYEAPNTNQGFVDLFARAIDDNRADAISTSWGDWEVYADFANAPVTDPTGGAETSSLAALHQLYVQAGLQGQSMMAAAGDAGAYDANDAMTPPDYSLALSIDSPGNDPAMTSAGGTTLAGTFSFAVKHKPDVVITIPTERVWGWDYLLPLCQALKLDPVACGILPVGGGGGVSIHFAVPGYQKGINGVQVSQPDQQFIDEDVVPPKVLYTLPAGFAGRNVPDVSLNADPETGYLIGYTSSAPGSTYGFEQAGGTSFSAPQLNGVTQLLVQSAGGRVGFLNPMLYAQSKLLAGYEGPHAPLRFIRAGGNEFYRGNFGYSPAAGVGTINVANLAAAAKAK